MWTGRVDGKALETGERHLCCCLFVDRAARRGAWGAFRTRCDADIRAGLRLWTWLVLRKVCVCECVCLIRTCSASVCVCYFVVMAESRLTGFSPDADGLCSSSVDHRCDKVCVCVRACVRRRRESVIIYLCNGFSSKQSTATQRSA